MVHQQLCMLGHNRNSIKFYSGTTRGVVPGPLRQVFKCTRTKLHSKWVQLNLSIFSFFSQLCTKEVLPWNSFILYAFVRELRLFYFVCICSCDVVSLVMVGVTVVKSFCTVTRRDICCGYGSLSRVCRMMLFWGAHPILFWLSLRLAWPVVAAAEVLGVLDSFA